MLQEKEIFPASVCSSLVGYSLGDALKTAVGMGYTIDEILVSSPPRMHINEYDDSFRVIRVKSLNNKV